MAWNKTWDLPGDPSLNFASKPSQRRNATPPGSEGEANDQPLGPCWSHVRSMDLSDHPWKICKSKLLTTGRAEADLNMKSCKVSWSPGKWGAELWSDPLEWCDQRGCTVQLPRSSQPGGNRKQLFCAIISSQCMYCRRGQEDVCFCEEPLLWIGNQQ